MRIPIFLRPDKQENWAEDGEGVPWPHFLWEADPLKRQLVKGPHSIVDGRCASGQLRDFSVFFHVDSVNLSRISICFLLKSTRQTEMGFL